MIKQKGGLKKRLYGRRLKNPEQILKDIINSTGVVANIISDGSLKCFVFEIVINDPAAYEYIDTNASGSFRNPVKRLVLKIIVVNDVSSMSNYTDSNGISHSKEADSESDIIEEALAQQTAWIRTSVNNRVPVCPSVADLIFLDNTNSKTFLREFNTKFGSNNQINKILVYLKDRLDGKPATAANVRTLCIMVMSEVSSSEQALARQAQIQSAKLTTEQAKLQAAETELQAAIAANTSTGRLNAKISAYKDVIKKLQTPQKSSITLYEFLKLPDGSFFQGLEVNKDQKNRAYSLIISCVMRLFWAGIIHFDLHVKNFLLYVDEDGVLQGKIIDLGNSIIFTTGTNKFIPNRADIDILLAGLEKYKTGIIGDVGSDTFIRKKDFVVDLLNMIKGFDTKGNHQVFRTTDRFDISIPAGQDDHTNCQMSWWQDVKDKEAADIAGTDTSFSDIINGAYDIARAGFMVNAYDPRGITTETIKRYIRENTIPDFDDMSEKDPATLIVSWPALTTAQAQAQAQGQGQGQGLFPGIAQANPGLTQVNPGGGARKKTRRKNKLRKNKTKRLALRKTKNKKRRRTSKK